MEATLGAKWCGEHTVFDLLEQKSAGYGVEKIIDEDGNVWS